MIYLTSSKFPDLDAKCNIVSLKKSFNIINIYIYIWNTMKFCIVGIVFKIN